MILFGGVNLKSYCEGSTLYEFSLDDKNCAFAFEDAEIKLKNILNKARESNLTSTLGTATVKPVIE